MRRDLRRCERGAIYVEALVMIPVLATLWVILLFVERGNTVDDEVVERGRYCAWRVAVDECEGGAPARCEVSGPERLDGATLDGVSGGALTRLGQLFPFVAGEFADPHGSVVRVTARDHLARPFGWGDVEVESHQTWMCQTKKRPWRDASVFAATCRHYGLAYCAP